MPERRASHTARAFGRLMAEEVHDAVPWAAARREPSGPSRERRARRLRGTLEELGPLYIKVGQILATRPDFVPQYVMDELAQLNDRVTVSPFSWFVPALQEELGADWEHRFSDFRTGEPLGTASLAQVYRATLADGSPCVVKIQRPGATGTVLGDMKVMRHAARVLRTALPEFSHVVDVGAMLEVLFKAMEDELDFTREARNQKDARKLARRYKRLRVPKVITATPRVLVMRLADGESVSRLKEGVPSASARKKIARDFMSYMFRGYFVDRFFHADPHPGNLLLSADGKGHLIDWGMVGRVDTSTSAALLGVFLALVRNDGPGLARQWMSLGSATPGSDVSGFIGDITREVPHWSDASLEELNFGVALTSVLRYSTRRGVRTTPMVSVVGKSLANAEGSVRGFHPKLKFSELLRTVLPDVMGDLVRERCTLEQGSEYVLYLMGLAQHAPGELQRLRTDLAERQLTVHTRSQAADSARRSAAAAALAGRLARRVLPLPES
ncbi:ABC1 kinase family protein [Streptomyces sp. NPDC000134]|uniref:ABC1 kinase family protein n=1 Tax=Streptomyces sp. NPDC000134 TaxID=3364536 RepID=UPI00367D8D04